MSAENPGFPNGVSIIQATMDGIVVAVVGKEFATEAVSEFKAALEGLEAK